MKQQDRGMKVRIQMLICKNNRFALSEPTKGSEKTWSALWFTAAGTILNIIGLILAIVIWFEVQRVYTLGIGLTLMLLGTGVFLTGQILDGKDKLKAKRLFLQINIWILTLYLRRFIISLSFSVLLSQSPAPLQYIARNKRARTMQR